MLQIWKQPVKKKFVTLLINLLHVMSQKKNDALYEQVLTKQAHTHSIACRKKGSYCRFHYPKPPSKCTLIASPDNMSENLDKEILVKVNNILNDDNIDKTLYTIPQILSLAKVSAQISYL
jgi:hypothetical protein